MNTRRTAKDAIDNGAIVALLVNLSNLSEHAEQLARTAPADRPIFWRAQVRQALQQTLAEFDREVDKARAFDRVSQAEADARDRRRWQSRESKR